ncbi:MAG: cytochrome b N-terminal domain-containing protein [Candidatus Micrarchaeia archaeon]
MQGIKKPQYVGQKDDLNKEYSIKSEIKSFVEFFYIKTVPSYGNNFFFTIGVYLLEIFGVLAITGMIMVLFGPYWWDLTAAGTFVRSIHLWAAEAFVTLILLHLFVQFSTSSFKKKRLVWMLGSAMLFLVFLEFAFGIGLRGDFVSQWNDKAGADLWNGLGLGYWVNPLNQGALLGWHIAIVPLLLVVLMFTHYMLVKNKGLSTPYKKGIPYSMVPANHKTMYRRMVYVLVIILLFAVFLRAPYVAPLTIQGVAQEHPNAMAITLLNEFNYSSGTATYLDTIDPYTFSTRDAYVLKPYAEYVNISHSRNEVDVLFAENASSQEAILKSAYAYFKHNGTIQNGTNSSNPLINIVSRLTDLAQTGAYQPILQSETASGLNQTYVIRFLADTGVLYSTATEYGLRTSQWGMIRAGGMWWQIGSYWVAPYNYLEIITAGMPWWSDLENGTVGAIVFALLVFLPYIPGLRDIPDKLRLYKIFWNRYTIPEMKKKRKAQ